jgi:hypothetical protein
MHMIRSSPAPAIDVWVILQQAAARLVDGGNLFASCWTANPDFRTECVYPYLPITTVVQVPFEVVFGDVRYASIAALVASALLVRRVAGPAPAAAALAVLVLLQPKLLTLIELAWTEPLLLLAVCVMVAATLAERPVLAVVGFATALAMKQHMVLLVPLAAWWPAFGWRKTVAAVSAALVVVAPFALADLGAFVDDVVWFHLRLPPRPDSLSVFSWLLEGGQEPSFLLVPLVTVAALALALTLPRDARGFVLGSAGVLLVFNAVNKQSFFNHYSLVLGLLVLAAALLARNEVGRPAELSPSAPAAPPASSPTASPV